MENIDFLNIQQFYSWIYQLVGSIFHFLNPFTIIDFLYKYWPQMMFYSAIISIVCIGCLYYLFQKFKEVRKKDHEVFNTVISPFADAKGQSLKNERWERILNYMESDSQTEWRLAILDADIILDQMLTKSGYHGDSTGEKLKQVEKSDFNTIDCAWEAHKIRNSIAHSGSDIILTKRMAKKTVDSYRQVFEEFEYI